MKKALRWVGILLGRPALDAAAVPRPKPGTEGAAGRRRAVASAPPWVIVVVIIAVAILLHQFVTRRKR